MLVEQRHQDHPCPLPRELSAHGVRVAWPGTTQTSQSEVRHDIRLQPGPLLRPVRAERRIVCPRPHPACSRAECGQRHRDPARTGVLTSTRDIQVRTRPWVSSRCHTRAVSPLMAIPNRRPLYQGKSSKYLILWSGAGDSEC